MRAEECGRGVADDRGAHPLAPVGVGYAEDGDVHDTGDLTERVLDLERVDVDPAGDDQVGAPALEVEVAVGVDASDVADGERRPVGRFPPCGGRLLGGTEVGEPGVFALVETCSVARDEVVALLDRAEVVDRVGGGGGAGEPVVTGVADQQCDDGGQDQEGDESVHGSNHAPMQFLPPVAGMPVSVDFLPRPVARC